MQITNRHGPILETIRSVSAGATQICKQKKTGQLSLARLRFRLEASDVRRLQAFRSASDLEFNRLTLVECLVPFGLNGRKVYENILAGLALNEPESLTGVEPFHCSLFSH